MINQGLTTEEAAARLGVKTATLYSYVSRGLLHPARTPDGSRYDLDEVLGLARSARRPGGRPSPSRSGRGAGAGHEPIFVTELTTIEGGRLYYRGLDAVTLCATRRFEEVAEWLWTGSWPASPTEKAGAWDLPERSWAAVTQVLGLASVDLSPIERFAPALMAASLVDELRHDLSPGGVPVTGRAIIASMVASLPLAARPAPPRAGRQQAERVSSKVWRGLTERAPTLAGMRALEAALVLAADHELAPSTLAARVAASFRADPYAVVMTALGPVQGTWQSGSTGAPGEVELLLRAAAELGPERAIGERLKERGELPHGFGMPLYPDGDPRAAALLERLEGVGPGRRVDLVRRVVAVAAARGFARANFDLGLAALAYCAGMIPGAAQAIFTLGKTAGWLAHAMEEYGRPTRFRMRADYVGSQPEDTPAS